MNLLSITHAHKHTRSKVQGVFYFILFFIYFEHLTACMSDFSPGKRAVTDQAAAKSLS